MSFTDWQFAVAYQHYAARHHVGTRNHKLWCETCKRWMGER